MLKTEDRPDLPLIFQEQTALIQIPLELLLALLLPEESTTPMGAWYEPERRLLSVMIHDPGLDPLAEGDLLPIIEPAYTSQFHEDCGHTTVTATWPLPHKPDSV